jgi:hypothetical protein
MPKRVYKNCCAWSPIGYAQVATARKVARVAISGWQWLPTAKCRGMTSAEHDALLDNTKSEMDNIIQCQVLPSFMYSYEKSLLPPRFS